MRIHRNTAGSWYRVQQPLFVFQYALFNLFKTDHKRVEGCHCIAFFARTMILRMLCNACAMHVTDKVQCINKPKFQKKPTQCQFLNETNEQQEVVSCWGSLLVLLGYQLLFALMARLKLTLWHSVWWNYPFTKYKTIFIWVFLLQHPFKTNPTIFWSHLR